MKLTALRLHNVKRFGGRGVAIEGIGDGVNVLSAANEHGKSTCFEALHALFFQPHTGTPKSVQLLRPYSGGNPVVEADIATEEGRYRLTKQYYGGKRASVTDLDSGRLVAQADEAEAFISALISGGSGGPAGLLWVRQGMTGIEKRTAGEEENEKRVRESLLTSVQGEVEALTGGRRMAEVIAACEEELFALVTATLRPKAGGRYSGALEERERLEKEEARLAGEVGVLREALDRRRVALARLAELDNAEEGAARLAAIAAAEAALEAAKSHGEALKAAEAEAALTRNNRDSARQALADFQAARERAMALQQRSMAAQQRREEAATRRAAAIADNERAQAQVLAAEEGEREGRALLARLDAALLAREAADRLVDLRQRLAQAEAARKQVEEAEATLATLALPQQAVEQLQKLDIELVGLRAAQAASLPALRMDYLPGVADAVTLDGKPLADGQEHGFAGAVRLSIAGIGTLALRSNRAPQADQAIVDGLGRQRALLASLGVESLAQARERQAAAQAMTGALGLARQRLADLAPKGVAQVQAEIVRLESLCAGELELKADPEQVRAQYAAVTERLAVARNSARETQPMRSQADAAVVAAETGFAAIEAELSGLLAMLGAQEGWAQRERALAEAAAAQQGLHAAAEARALPLRTAGHDLAGAEASLARARSVQRAAMQEAEQQRVVLAELTGSIDARTSGAVEEDWREAGEALLAARQRVEGFETEIAVLDRLRKTLTAARSAARDLYLKPVISELLPLMHLLFEDVSITFDETTLLPQTVRRNGQEEDVERLSGGMREQLSVLTRLAFARLLARDGRPTPVILDDALVYSDDERIERMFDALHRQSRDQQILVFSCRQRAFAKLGGNVLQMSDWTPPTG